MEASCHPRNRPKTVARGADGRRKTGGIRVPPTWWILWSEAAEAMEAVEGCREERGDYCDLSKTGSDVSSVERGGKR